MRGLIVFWCLVSLIMLFALDVRSDTVTTNGYTWTYNLSADGTVSLGNGDDCAISPSPEGNLVVPSILNGCILTSIGKSAFSGCSNLLCVTIPVDVMSIGERAFFNCSGLTSVTIPSAVASIGKSAFCNCSRLTSVIIPDSVTSIGEGAFSGCSGLIEMSIPFVGDRRAQYGSRNSHFGHIFGYQSYTGGIRISQSNGLGLPSSHCYIPASLRKVVVTSEKTLGVGAFDGCSRLTSITIPASVTSIELYAFCACSGLSNMVLPNSVTSIDSSAFSLCSGIMNVEIPQCVCVTNIATMFPASYQNITNVIIADGTVKISQSCFSGCQALQAIKLPSSINNIGAKAFENCNSLEVVRFLGDAPDVSGTIYLGTQRSLVTYVTEGSKGWSGGVSEVLPETWPVGDSTARAIAYWNGPDETVTSVPSVTPPDGTLFLEMCEVSISCVTEGATIYYTTNGTTPRISSRYAYTGPFTVSNSITVKAVAVAEGLERSEYVTATIIKVNELTMSLALGSPIGVSVETGGNAEWTPIGDTSSPESGLAAKSGEIGELGATWLEAMVNGAGTFSFWWRVSCEKDDAGTTTWDHLLCETDGNEVARIDGVTEWERREIVFKEATNHTIRWTYKKDDYDEDDVNYRDCAWVTGLEWNPTAVIVPSNVTGGKPVIVEKEWADSYTLFNDIFCADFAVAVTQRTEKVTFEGKPMFMWQDYVAGTDPTDMNDFLRAMISMKGGMPDVTWTPNLNTNGEVRVYKVWGKADLMDSAWTYPTNSTHRFFKVTVEMP